MQEAQR